MRESPDRWISTTLSEIAFIQMGQSPDSRAYNDRGEGLPFFQGKAEFGKLFPTVRKWCTEPKKIAEAGDILLSVRAPVGPTNLALEQCCIGRGLAAIRVYPPCDQKYLFYYFRSIEAWLAQQGTGTTFAAIGGNFLRDLDVPLAPLNEQKRIADKLDRILSKVDACRERCDRIPLLLKRFRQSVLAAATSGQLTEDWREANNKNLRDWEETTVGELIDDIEAGINVRCDERPPLPHEQGLVKISAVTWGTFDDSESKTLPSDKIAPESTRIAVGDFLISRANTLELVGACVIVEQVTRPVYLSDKVLRLVMNDAYKKWLLFWLRSEKGRSQIEWLASGNQLSMRNLTQANLKSIVVRLPDKDERNELIRRVETLFAYADRLEAQYQKARTHLDLLTPALLDKAFRGELVPQDPNDEPASVLLERIRSEISKTQPRKTKRLIEFIPSLHSVVPVAMLTRKEIQPSHLSAILKERGPLTAESLWTASQLDIDDFYDQLKDEEAQGLLRETRGEDPNAARLLEVA